MVGFRMHELVPGQPVTVRQIYESKQDEVVQGRDFVITFTYVSIELDQLASVDCNNQQINS